MWCTPEPPALGTPESSSDAVVSVLPRSDRSDLEGRNTHSKLDCISRVLNESPSAMAVLPWHSWSPWSWLEAGPSRGSEGQHPQAPAQLGPSRGAAPGGQCRHPGTAAQPQPCGALAALGGCHRPRVRWQPGDPGVLSQGQAAAVLGHRMPHGSCGAL